MAPDKETTITIYAMPGSQFTGKVLAALDARNINHYCVFVPMRLEERRKVIPSGGTFVPEMKVITVTTDEKKDDDDGNTDGENPTIVPDSEDILLWLDDNLNTNYFPNESARDISRRASSKQLAGCVWYFNWVDEEGYCRSMKKTMARAMLPSYIPAIASEFIVNLFLGSIKAKYRQLSMEALGVTEEDLMDRSKVLSILREELTHFQSHLKADDQQYLLGTDSTAADFSVYAQVERLVGDMGDANVLPSIPEFKDETPELGRFWKWYALMRERHPIVFKGKRPPKA